MTFLSRNSVSRFIKIESFVSDYFGTYINILNFQAFTARVSVLKIIENLCFIKKKLSSIDKCIKIYPCSEVKINIAYPFTRDIKNSGTTQYHRQVCAINAYFSM